MTPRSGARPCGVHQRALNEALLRFIGMAVWLAPDASNWPSIQAPPWYPLQRDFAELLLADQQVQTLRGAEICASYCTRRPLAWMCGWFHSSRDAWQTAPC